MLAKLFGILDRYSCCASEVDIFLHSSRIYSPPDSPGYFDGHVWPMYLKHKQEMEENETDIGMAKTSFNMH